MRIGPTPALIGLLCVGFQSLCAFAALTPTPTRRSQQFTVYDNRPVPNTAPAQKLLEAEAKKQTNIVQLNPDVLLLSAERIREALLSELQLPMRGGGRIHLLLGPSMGTNDEITVVESYSPDGWQYRLAIPEHMEPFKLIRGVVHALLLEISNRGGGPKSAEIPIWVDESLSVHVLAVVGPELIVRSVPLGTMARTLRLIRGIDPMRETREHLRTHQALSLVELSFPRPDQLVGDNLRTYQHSAHLFFSELLKTPNGPVNFVRMLRELPSCWNWQTALLRTFRPPFDRILDVEKWWSVNVAAFVGREANQVWTRELCLAKLDEILTPSAQVRFATNALPLRLQVTLQELITEWSYDEQKPILWQTIRQLAILRANAPPGVAQLIDSYRNSLEKYLRKRNQSGFSPPNNRQLMIQARPVVLEAIRELDQLLRFREVLRREQAAVGLETDPR